MIERFIFFGVLQEFFFEPVQRESNPKRERHFFRSSFSSVYDVIQSVALQGVEVDQLIFLDPLPRVA